MIAIQRFKSPTARRKLSIALKRPDIRRGGNGWTNPLATALKKLLGPGWIVEYTVPLGPGSRRAGYPPRYIVDIGNPRLKVAVELDGRQHRKAGRILLDKKKTDKLHTLGWHIVRIENNDVSEILNAER
jgi:hypothetical protein